MSPEPLIRFLESQNRSQYVNYPTISVYVRKGRHVCEGVPVETIDFANLDVDKPNCLETAWAIHDWVVMAESVARETGRRLYVECVHNPILQSFFRRRGYLLVNPLDHCYLDLRKL